MGGIETRIQNLMAEDEKYDFPDTLEGFGYKFNEAGQLRHMETDEPYDFNVREGDHHYNQKLYNALGDVLTEYIYKIMESSCKLQKSYLPVDAEKTEPRSFVFFSGDLYTNPKLLILIHGSGAVRAGQWARRLIINDCINSGSQLPYIRWARKNGYAVIVANTNINTAELTEKKRKPSQVKIRGNSSPEEHTESVWREFVQRSAARYVAIVAHSYGGVCTLELAMNHIREFEDRVFAIALTDSVHGMRQQEARPEVVEFYKQCAVNWASAYDPLDTPLITTQDEVPTVSAGTDRHENTSHSAMNSIFKYFTERYEERMNPSIKRISIGEPSVIHNSPSLNEQQGLVSRGQAVGQESGEPSGTQHEKETKEVNEISTQQGTGDEKIRKTGEEKSTAGVDGTLHDKTDKKEENSAQGTEGESTMKTGEENSTAGVADTLHDKTDKKEETSAQGTEGESPMKTGEENSAAGVADTLHDKTDKKEETSVQGTEGESTMKTGEENQSAEENKLLIGSDKLTELEMVSETNQNHENDATNQSQSSKTEL